MSYDYSKLRGRIIELFKTNRNFAKAINCSERTLSLFLNNKRPFKQETIALFCNKLNIKENEIASYFFKHNVQAN